MPFPNEHSARIKPPGQFTGFNRVNNRGANGVDFIFGLKGTGTNQTSEVQAIRFDDKIFTPVQAREWLKDNDFTAILFEPSTGEMGKHDKGFFPNLSDIQFFKSFKGLKSDDRVAASLHFREAFNFRDLDFTTNPSPAFCQMAKSVLPGLLKKSIKCKNVDAVLSGSEKEIKVYKSYHLSRPYLLREPNELEYVGVIRLGELKKVDKEVRVYSIRDAIPFKSFISLFSKAIISKLNVEKMQMFSLVYKNVEAWREPDTEDDFMTQEEIRKAINWSNPRGLGLNIEHDGDETIGRDRAEVVESYQTRAAWNEDGLEIRKGDWVATTQFHDKKLWDFTKQNIETYSMEGEGLRSEASLPEVN